MIAWIRRLFAFSLGGQRRAGAFGLADAMRRQGEEADRQRRAIRRQRSGAPAREDALFDLWGPGR